MMPKKLFRGRFGFWCVGKNFMTKRDAVVARHFRNLGITNERYRIIALIENQMSDYEQGSEEFDVLADAVALIKGDDK
jgi:hypothetical protein